MKKFLLNILVFSAIIFVPISIINYYLGYVELDCYRWSFEELREKKYPTEGMIIGNSQAVHGIRPIHLDSLGIPFLNFALNGSDAKFWLNWYEQIYKESNYPKPKYCIYTLTYRGKRKYESDSQFFPLATFLKNYFGFNDFDKETLLKNRFPIFKFRTYKTIEEKIQSEATFDYEDYNKGYISYKKKTETAVPDVVKRSRSNIKNVLNGQIIEESNISFEKLVNKMRADGIQLILVKMPVFRANAKRRNKRNEAGNKYLEFYYELADEKDIPILDYSQEEYRYLFSNKDFFVDILHLNATGSSHFSSLLKDDVMKIMNNRN